MKNARQIIMVLVIAIIAASCTKSDNPNSGGNGGGNNGNTYNGHEYVDLGLPSGTLWATCNVGATTPEGYGDYFAWGETIPKETYNWMTYKWGSGNESDGWQYRELTKYCSDSTYGLYGFHDNLTELLPEDDAATANWGNGWRTPTRAQWRELVSYTFPPQATFQNNVKGFTLKSANGNSIFLPITGKYMKSGFIENSAEYWSSTKDYSHPKEFYANSFMMVPEYDWEVCEWDARYIGNPIRPVRSAN